MKKDKTLRASAYIADLIETRGANDRETKNNREKKAGKTEKKK